MSVIILMINKSDSRDFVIICMIRDRIVLHSVLLTVLIFFLLQRLGDLCALAVANSRIDYKSARIPQAVKDILGRLVWTLLLSSGNLFFLYCFNVSSLYKELRFESVLEMPQILQKLISQPPVTTDLGSRLSR